MADINPEALHDIGQAKGMQTEPAFVNPGTPESALVSREQMTQATIQGSASESLRANLIK